jgi:hypothetical protein
MQYIYNERTRCKHLRVLSGGIMTEKQNIIERLNVLQMEVEQAENEFRKTLSNITGKTLRTIRRWYAKETSIHDDDLHLIAEYFGQHENWLKFGDLHNHQSMIDQVLISEHYGAVITNKSRAENINHKFIEMMNLSPDQTNGADPFDYLFDMQNEQTLALYNISTDMAQENGFHHHNMTIKLNNGHSHCMDITTLKISNNKLLRIFMNKGQIVRT